MEGEGDEGWRERERGRGREEGMEEKEVRGRIPCLSTNLFFNDKKKNNLQDLMDIALTDLTDIALFANEVCIAETK